jgi:hypothetical protein
MFPCGQLTPRSLRRGAEAVKPTPENSTASRDMRPTLLVTSDAIPFLCTPSIDNLLIELCLQRICVKLTMTFPVLYPLMKAVRV